MLPIFRIIPIGGVLLAILLLVLALDAPEQIHTQLAPPLTPMRGPLISLGDHPEWRQLLMRAAIRRASELNRLRDLPDTPAPAAPAEKFASLPAQRIDADSGPDTTASATQPPPTTIPIEIGETSSVELPVVLPRERPPVITPARIKSGHESRARHAPRARRARSAKQPPPPFDLFRAMFADPRAVQQQEQQSRRQQSQQQQPAFGFSTTTTTTTTTASRR
jgi:hypothetical protein